MFDIFDSILVGEEIEYEGKTYLRLTTLKDDYTLDEVGTVSFPTEGVICTLNITEW